MKSLGVELMEKTKINRGSALRSLSMKGNYESNILAVYVSGVVKDGFRKLLDAPETKDGTGLAESDVGMVFNTTSANTSAESGACKYLEEYIDTPILWLACHHHVYQLQLQRVVQEIFTRTKD